VARVPHDFRRTAIRNLERDGVPRSVAMAMVGQKTDQVYRRYAIVDEAMIREAAVKMIFNVFRQYSLTSQHSATYRRMSRSEARPRPSPVRSFFPSYQAACAEADGLLFAVGVRERLESAFQEACVGKLTGNALGAAAPAHAAAAV
jgi:hypothetical protein